MRPVQLKWAKVKIESILSRRRSHKRLWNRECHISLPQASHMAIPNCKGVRRYILAMQLEEGKADCLERSTNDIRPCVCLHIPRILNVVLRQSDLSLELVLRARLRSHTGSVLQHLLCLKAGILNLGSTDPQELHENSSGSL